MDGVALRLVALAALGALSACAGQGGAGSDSYGDGYAAGCQYAYRDVEFPGGEFQKNRTRYASDPQYKGGWDAGYGRCIVDAGRTRNIY